MKWVKASDRLPESGGDIIWRFIGYFNNPGCGFKDMFGFWDHTGSKTYTKDYDNIEWLDETPEPD